MKFDDRTTIGIFIGLVMGLNYAGPLMEYLPLFFIAGLALLFRRQKSR